MSRPRDTQRSAVYDAEQMVRIMFDRAEERDNRVVEVLGSQLTLPVERKFASLASVQTYVDAVLALDWVPATWPDAGRTVTVRARSGSAAAHYESDTATVAVPLHRGNRAWALRELVVFFGHFTAVYAYVACSWLSGRKSPTQPHLDERPDRCRCVSLWSRPR